jgi:glutathione-regulated potassium-efflux system ancillary protein KefC/glutathione-regulated potassium-efflux system protein KefB
MSAFVPQAGELAFVVVATALAHGVLTRPVADLLIVVTTISMAATPLVVAGMDRLVLARLASAADERTPALPGEGDEPPDRIVVIGLGRFGQLVGRFLHTAGVRFTALDSNPAQVEFLRGFGHHVSYGNAARNGVLAAAGVDQARAVVLAVNNIDESVRIAESLRQFYPNVPVYALARSRAHAWRLMDEGIETPVRATLGPSIELGRRLLAGCGWPGESIERLTEDFREREDWYMAHTHALHRERGTAFPTDADVERELIDLFDRLPRDR